MDRSRRPIALIAVLAAIAVLIACLSGCVSRSARVSTTPVASSHSRRGTTAGSATGHAGSTAAVEPPADDVATHVGGLTLTHPASWRRYPFREEQTLYPQSEAILTDEPETSACLRRRMTCSDPVAALSSDGVYVLIDVITEQPGQGLSGPPNSRVAGYPAQVQQQSPDSSGCPRGTQSALDVTIGPRDREPAAVWIFGCFGDITGATHREFNRMIATARLTTRPPADVPVRGSVPCRAAELRIGRGGYVGGVSQTEAAGFSVRNVGAHTCSLSGFPAVRLRPRRPVQSVVYRYGDGLYGNIGSKSTVYLLPGNEAVFVVSKVISDDVCRSAAAVSVPSIRIELDLGGTHLSRTLPATDSDGGLAFDVCVARPNTVYVGHYAAY